MYDTSRATNHTSGSGTPLRRMPNATEKSTPRRPGRLGERTTFPICSAAYASMIKKCMMAIESSTPRTSEGFFGQVIGKRSSTICSHANARM